MNMRYVHRFWEPTNIIWIMFVDPNEWMSVSCSDHSNKSLYTNLYTRITKVHTQIYTSSPMFHTSNFWGSARNGHEQYTTYLVLYRLNHIGQHIHPCGQVDDTSLLVHNNDGALHNTFSISNLHTRSYIHALYVSIRASYGSHERLCMQSCSS
jgi:hypothetical protein